MRLFGFALMCALCLLVEGQGHYYIPAHIVIPTLNVSAIQHFNNTAFNQTWNNTNSVPNNTWGYNNVNPPPFQVWNQTTRNGDLIVGQIGLYDHLLFNQSYFKPSRWYSSREKIIEYPRDAPGGFGRHETISAIRIYNKFYNGLESQAKIKEGGVGAKFVKIKLTSNFGRGFHYLVQLFGH